MSLTIDPLFSRLYHRQLEFQLRLHGTWPEHLEDETKMAYIREQALALTDELHEALSETGWKSWATSNHINRDAFLGELAEVNIFLWNLLLAAGISMSELAQEIDKKQMKNIKRQDEGYDGVTTKCPICKRAYDDEAVKCFPPSPTGNGYCNMTGDSLP